MWGFTAEAAGFKVQGSVQGPLGAGLFLNLFMVSFCRLRSTSVKSGYLAGLDVSTCDPTCK